MDSTMFEKALGYLYRQLRDTRIALGHAESRPGVKQEELDNLSGRIEMLEWLTGVVLAHEEKEES